MGLTRARIIILSVLGLVAVGCGASQPDSEDTTFHQQNLAEGETRELAAMLVAIPGYTYVDASDYENRAVTQFFDLNHALTAGSLHTVVDSDSDEVGFLQLWSFRSGYLPEAPQPDWVGAFVEIPFRDQFAIGDQRVFALENPKNPSSRYWYVWLDDKTVGVIDGTNDESLRTWVETYIAKLSSGSSRG